VTRGQLPQRAGSLGLNGGGTAAMIPPVHTMSATKLQNHDIYTGRMDVLVHP